MRGQYFLFLVWNQGWEFALSFHFFKKSDESESLFSLFTKRPTEANHSFCSLQKERIWVNHSHRSLKRGTRAKWAYWHIAPYTFSNTRAIHSIWKKDSLFLKVGFAPFWRENWKLDFTIYCISHFLIFDFVKNKKEWRERFTLVALWKEFFKERFALLKRAKEHFALFVKKRVICIENQRANSQPCPKLREPSTVVQPVVKCHYFLF